MNFKAILLILCAMAAVTAGAQQPSPYISKVFEYRPAPGQFVNTMPVYADGDNADSMAVKAGRLIINNNQGIVSLGAWGGTIVLGFDHRIENISGKTDFQVLGNAFFANANPNKNASPRGGSSEPGIIMVSRDDNGNGLPDDEWYEIAGSEYHNPNTRHNYTVTYHRTPADHKPTPNNSYRFLNDTTYIRWDDSEGRHGYVSRNVFHKQDYYPSWIEADSMVFTGTCLPDNYVDESGKGNYYVQYCYGHGYVDNVPDNDSLAKVNIEWAVDADGQPAMLDGIDFIKVYTGLNQYCGWLGETSTEVTGAMDLHLTGDDIPDPVLTAITTVYTAADNGKAVFRDMTGHIVATPQKGHLYIMSRRGQSRKIIWK